MLQSCKEVLFSLRAKDNLCIKDKEAAPKVSFIERLHCTCVPEVLYQGLPRPIDKEEELRASGLAIPK